MSTAKKQYEKPRYEMIMFDKSIMTVYSTCNYWLQGEGWTPTDHVCHYGTPNRYYYNSEDPSMPPLEP